MKYFNNQNCLHLSLSGCCSNVVKTQRTKYFTCWKDGKDTGLFLYSKMIGGLAKETAIVHLRVRRVVSNTVAVISEDVGGGNRSVLCAGVELPPTIQFVRERRMNSGGLFL